MRESSSYALPMDQQNDGGIVVTLREREWQTNQGAAHQIRLQLIAQLPGNMIRYYD